MIIANYCLINKYAITINNDKTQTCSTLWITIANITNTVYAYVVTCQECDDYAG